MSVPETDIISQGPDKPGLGEKLWELIERHKRFVTCAITLVLVAVGATIVVVNRPQSTESASLPACAQGSINSDGRTVTGVIAKMGDLSVKRTTDERGATSLYQVERRGNCANSPNIRVQMRFFDPQGRLVKAGQIIPLGESISLPSSDELIEVLVEEQKPWNSEVRYQTIPVTTLPTKSGLLFMETVNPSEMPFSGIIAQVVELNGGRFFAYSRFGHDADLLMVDNVTYMDCRWQQSNTKLPEFKGLTESPETTRELKPSYGLLELPAVQRPDAIGYYFNGEYHNVAFKRPNIVPVDPNTCAEKG